MFGVLTINWELVGRVRVTRRSEARKEFIWFFEVFGRLMGFFSSSFAFAGEESVRVLIGSLLGIS